jgi:beta-galactosidase
MEIPVYTNPSRSSRPFTQTALLWALVLVLLPAAAFALPARDTMPEIAVINDESGSRMQVDGRDFMIFGMNWGYMPIGENYSYAFWNHSDEFIKIALATEMSLLQDMGVNVIRHYVGMPPRWVQYVYETYGIFTVLNHPMGRYGLTIDGAWLPNTDYSDPQVRATLKAEIAAMVDEFADTPGILMWLLGNENNYGLSWSSFEIEALPEGERHAAKARYLYSLYGEIIRDIKRRDPGRPVAMANGDLQYIDLIAEECEGLDVLGSNVYRGISARDFFEVVRDKLGVPTLFTEFGADAFNAVTMQEDQKTQARYLIGQWQEIYEQSAGKGRVGNAIGGLIFQWSDGWWKFRQEERLDIHDTNASWPNGGYWEDFREGDNNMNEEWWGICAKGYSNSLGHYEIYPRAAYYALRDAFRLDPYAPGTDLAAIRAHFGRIQPMGAELAARGNTASLKTGALSKLRVSGLRAELETFSTGGENVSTPPTELPQAAAPSYLGFDHGQSFYVDFEAKPSDALIGTVSLNILGRVPRNPIDESFYENRGLPHLIIDGTGEELELGSHERVKVYQASVTWDDRWFMLDAFYRGGHLHWQYQGDFFGLYRDAFYGENVDIYNGMAPIGVEIAGKKQLSGLTVAFGPQLWWGANPAFFAKYQRSQGRNHWTAIFQEEFAQQTQLTSSVAIPIRTTRKASLQLQRPLGPFAFEGGVLWSGSPRVGDSFQLITDEAAAGGPVAPEDVRQDLVKEEDTWGFKGKLTLQRGPWNWYGQAAYMGLVAEAGPTSIPTFTGWGLRDSGSGNQVNALTGLAVTVGRWQIGPNLLWQKPIVGAMPHADDLAGTPGRPRNVLDDPFAVRYNRETTGAELMITFDPTPASWLWAWDNDVREDADFAASFGLTFKRHHGGADAGLFISHTQEVWAHAGATPARDLWELRSRMVKRFGGSIRMITSAYLGTDEPNGDDPRTVERYGIDTRIVWPSMALAGYLKVNDFGPYDYHRDFNLTYPLQLMGDLSYTLGKPRWFGLPQTRFGIRGTYRTLDRYSNRYSPEGVAEPGIGESYPEGLPEGKEWEIRTYLHLSI